MTIPSVITVKFFASLREYVGQSDAEVADSKANTVAEVWSQATKNMTLPDNTLMAVNMDYVDAAHSVKAGDEVAFFPPVTGG
jgi:molybdopterin synthase sulfur carrier subunit